MAQELLYGESAKEALAILHKLPTREEVIVNYIEELDRKIDALVKARAKYEVELEELYTRKNNGRGKD